MDTRIHHFGQETSDERGSPKSVTAIACARTRVGISALKPDCSDLNRYLLGYSPSRVPSNSYGDRMMLADRYRDEMPSSTT